MHVRWSTRASVVKVVQYASNQCLNFWSCLPSNSARLLWRWKPKTETMLQIVFNKPYLVGKVGIVYCSVVNVYINCRLRSEINDFRPLYLLIPCTLDFRYVISAYSTTGACAYVLVASRFRHLWAIKPVCVYRSCNIAVLLPAGDH